jgi:hypothetical protein
MMFICVHTVTDGLYGLPMTSHHRPEQHMTSGADHVNYEQHPLGLFPYTSPGVLDPHRRRALYELPSSSTSPDIRHHSAWPGDVIEWCRPLMRSDITSNETTRRRFMASLDGAPTPFSCYDVKDEPSPANTVTYSGKVTRSMINPLT